MAATPTTVTVKVKADLSAFRHATVDEVAAVLAEHVYGDGGPVAGGDGPLSVLHSCCYQPLSSVPNHPSLS